MAHETRQLVDVLADEGSDVRMTPIYIGRVPSPFGGVNYDNHKFEIVLTRGTRSVSTQFYTGIGSVFDARRMSTPKRLPDPRLCKWQVPEQAWKPMLSAGGREQDVRVCPSVADVIYCLMADATALDSDFESWASDLGYDSDSRKALDTYLTCQRLGKQLREVLGAELFTLCQNAEH